LRELELRRVFSMRVKEVLIKIEGLEEAGKRVAEVYNKTKAGKKIASEEILAFENLEALRRVLTSRRISLLRIVRAKKPKTIYALAKLANRAYPNVFQDVKILEELGLIALEEDNNGLEPIAKYNALKITISV